MLNSGSWLNVYAEPAAIPLTTRFIPAPAPVQGHDVSERRRRPAQARLSVSFSLVLIMVIRVFLHMPIKFNYTQPDMTFICKSRNYHHSTAVKPA
jgi:hypothetical protein